MLLEDRLALTYYRLEARQESTTPLTLAERVSLAMLRQYHRVADRAQWLAAFRYASLARAYHQLSGNLVSGPPPKDPAAAQLTPADLIAQMPSSWKAPAASPRPASPPAIVLSQPAPLRRSLTHVLAERTSVRRYGTRALSLDEISSFLGATCGTRTAGDRTYPSGGGLYPVEAFFVPLRSEPSRDGLAPGVYRYAAAHHMLLPVAGVGGSDELARMLLPVTALENAPAALLFFVADLSRVEKKYGEFGYRLALLEAGHMGQNAYLVATAMELACVALGIGNFSLWHVNRGLDIDGVDRTVVHSMVLGPRAGDR